MQPHDPDAAAETSAATLAAASALNPELYSVHRRAYAKVKKPSVERPAPIDAAHLARQWEDEAVAGISPFRRAARREAREHARAMALQRAEQFNASLEATGDELERLATAAWSELRAHQPDRVIAALDDAFATAGLPATCDDAGLRDGRRSATLIVIFPPIVQIPSTVPGTNARGDEIARRVPKAERNALYVTALGSTVLGTVKCAFANAPSLEEARVIVLRHDQGAARVADRLQPIYRGSFDRVATASLSWRSLDAGTEILTGDDAQLRRRGVANDIAPLDARTDPALVTIVAKFRALLEAAPHP